MMKAAVCRAFGEPLVVEDIEIAEPQAGEIKVKLAACAICHSDILYAEGAWGGDLPAVYGHEASGVVEAVGTGVTTVAPGDHVVVTLIRSCGHCHYCAQGALVACETSFPLDEKSPLTAANGESLDTACAQVPSRSVSSSTPPRRWPSRRTCRWNPPRSSPAASSLASARWSTPPRSGPARTSW